MRYQRNTVLAGVAALALLAGGSLASAQENQTSQSQTSRPQVNHEMKMNKSAASDKMNKSAASDKMNKSAASDKMSQGAQKQKTSQSAQQSKTKQTAQEQKSGAEATKSKQQAANTTSKAAGSSKRTAQIKQRNHHAMARTGKTRGTATAEERGRMTRQNTANAQERGRMTRQNTATRERKGLEGLQGNAQGNNAAGMNAQGNPQGMQRNAQGMQGVQLSEQQRGQIRNTVINAPGAPRAENVQFNVAPGTVVPRGSIHIVPVPRTLVRIEPRWRGFRYFVWMDDVVIVDPHDMRIVAVVPA